MKKMKSTTIPWMVSLFIFISLVSCEKYNKDIEGDISIYLLEDFNTVDNSMVIEADGIVLADDPIISYGEILEYNSEEYSFRLTSEASTLVGREFGSAFAVTLEDKIIYTGYFWSSVSSAIVDWVVADITLYEYNNVMTVQLGYPWLSDSMNIPDKRNDIDLLSVFARDGKLID
jgi:hypothetical protein